MKLHISFILLFSLLHPCVQAMEVGLLSRNVPVARATLMRVPHAPKTVRTSSLHAELLKPHRPSSYRSSLPHVLFSHGQQSKRPAWHMAAALGVAGGIAVGAGANAYADEQNPQPKPKLHNNPHDAREAFIAQLKAKPWGKVAEKYLGQLHAEESNLMSEFRKLVGSAPGGASLFVVVEQTFKEDVMKSWEPQSRCDELHMKECASTHPAVHQMIVSLLEECGIDPSVIAIGTKDSNEGTAFSAYGFIGFPSTLAGFDIPQEQQKTMILHEIAHLLNHDGITGGIIEGIVKELPLAVEQRQDFITRYSKFREKRADTFCALLSPDCAYHWAEYFNQEPNKIRDHVSDKFGEQYSTTHPTPLERFWHVRKIGQEMAPEKQFPWLAWHKDLTVPQMVLGAVMIAQVLG